MTRIIHLTKGFVALVDDEDYNKLIETKWHYSNGYAKHRSWENGKRTCMSIHRVVMNAQPGQEVDHINGNGLDNRRANLRFATHSQNLCNSKKRVDGKLSKYKGVTRHNNKWKAQIQGCGIYKHIGYFTDEVEAALAYDAKAREYFGEFARPNFPK